jgi:hypothetical protein
MALMPERTIQQPDSAHAALAADRRVASQGAARAPQNFNEQTIGTRNVFENSNASQPRPGSCSRSGAASARRTKIRRTNYWKEESSRMTNALPKSAPARAAGLGKRHPNGLPRRSARAKAGWTPERRARQAAAIHLWQPWRRSTGPRTAPGKALVATNALRHGCRSRAWIDKAKRIRRAIRLCAETVLLARVLMRQQQQLEFLSAEARRAKADAATRNTHPKNRPERERGENSFRFLESAVRRRSKPARGT